MAMLQKRRLAITTNPKFLMKAIIKKVEMWLNIVHYCIYKVDYKLHILFNKLNPFLLIGKIPAVKKKFEEQETSLKEVGDRVWTDKRYGFGIMISGGGIIVILFFLIWGFVSSFLGLLKIYFLVKPLYISVYALISYLICHFLVFRQDKYIRYFKQFDKWSTQEKRKYGLLSFAFIVLTCILWIYSFRFTPLS